MRVPTEIFSRVVGYFRPVSQWNKGKKEEFMERKPYVVPDMKDLKAYDVYHTMGSLSAGAGMQAGAEERKPRRILAASRLEAEGKFDTMQDVIVYGKKITRIVEVDQ
jgi:hypothetical protein